VNLVLRLSLKREEAGGRRDDMHALEKIFRADTRYLWTRGQLVKNVDTPHAVLAQYQLSEGRHADNEFFTWKMLILIMYSSSQIIFALHNKRARLSL
jgi:hypothetical protein